MVGVFAQRITYMQEYAEKTAMEMTVANMRTGLRYKMAELMIQHRLAEMPNLLGENPINWLAKPPDNYAGEFVNPELGVIRPGDWYFDKGQRKLFFRLNHSRYFEGDGRSPTIGFHAVGVFQKKMQGGVEVASIESIRLEAISPIHWL